MRMARWQNRLNFFCLCRVGSCPCLCLLSSHSSLYNAMFVPLTATFSLFEKAQNRITIAESALLLLCYCTMVVFLSWLCSLSWPMLFCILLFLYICIWIYILICCLCSLRAMCMCPYSWNLCTFKLSFVIVLIFAAVYIPVFVFVFVFVLVFAACMCLESRLLTSTSPHSTQSTLSQFSLFL